MTHPGLEGFTGVLTFYVPPGMDAVEAWRQHEHLAPFQQVGTVLPIAGGGWTNAFFEDGRFVRECTEDDLPLPDNVVKLADVRYSRSRRGEISALDSFRDDG